MPKASRATAAGDMGVSDDEEEIEARLGAFDVNFVRYSEDGDAGMERWETVLAGHFCPRSHWGYVLEGKQGFRFRDRDEIYEAGDAFYVPPGHRPLNRCGRLRSWSPTACRP